MLLEIHKRLQQIKAVLPDVAFGGVSIPAIGDLYQLPPVGQAPVHSGSLWVAEFQRIELIEIMRRRDDSAFCQLLCKVRTDERTSDDISVLKSREIPPDFPIIPICTTCIQTECRC